MKHLVLRELLRHLSSHPRHRRRLKTIAFFGLFLFIGAMGLTVWAGVGAYRAITQIATEVRVPEQVNAINDIARQMSLPDQLATVEQKFSAVTTTNCWNQAQNLLQLSPWLTTPLGQIFTDLKQACWAEKISPELTESHHSGGFARESI